jgi:molybdopterin/thiamine biosynthesis adenylyltransferase/rhodanese-related sulfurtransferase
MSDPRSGLTATLARLRERIPEITPEQAAQRQHQGAVLVDVREADEVADGQPENAVHLPRGRLELEAPSRLPDPSEPVLLLCAGGTRSLLAAGALQDLGYRQVASVAGGFSAWKAAGLPVHLPAAAGTDALARYRRQINLPEVGEAGQRRLRDTRVLLIGAGGLGSPAALYLAAAGVGTLGIVDDDRVERSNLHRQVLHTDAAIGLPKAYSAKLALAARNPEIRIVPHVVRLGDNNVAELIADYDLVVDGSDNFATRYRLNDACVAAGKPLVHAAIHRFEGQVTVIDPARGGPCYRCLFPEPPPPELAPSCSEAGVLGVLPGLIGLLQASEALKLALGIGTPLTGTLLCIDTLGNEFRRLRVAARPGCPVCGEHRHEASA